MVGSLQPTERKTKIVCTVGPATRSAAQLQELLRAGMDVVRLNFSHGNHQEHGHVIKHIRHLATQFEAPLAILQDLAGPKVRIGAFAGGAITLTAGDSFTLTTRASEGNQRQVSVSYPLLPQEVKPGDTLLLADGAVELEVEQITTEDIHCRVTVGGLLSAHKGVNCPSGLFSLPILGEQDLQDLRFGLAHNVDYVGLSFVRTANDVHTAKQEIHKHGKDIPVIAKIETQAALTHFDEILDAADGIMVARGDLGIETSFARVPLVQKELIAKANRHAKPVITATHMLRSMVESPRPSRAEAADVANAVLDGSDALMLSEETAVGRYPSLVVQTMAAIASATEHAPQFPLWKTGADSSVSGDAAAVTHAASELAARLRADAIVTVTVSGLTARLVARYRPAQPILAATPRLETYRRLSLVRGALPLLLPSELSTREAMIASTTDILRERGWQGKKVVVVSSITPTQNVLTTDVL